MPYTTKLNRAFSFPQQLQVEDPEMSGTGEWVIRGKMDPNSELVSRHESLTMALAQFGAALYKLERAANALSQAKTVGAKHGSLSFNRRGQLIDGPAVYRGGALGADR